MSRRWERGRRKYGLVSALLAGVFAAAAILLFLPSAGATSIVQLQSPAVLISKGAAVGATVLVECKLPKNGTVAGSSTPARATLTITLSENTGVSIAGGAGKALSRNGDFPCDGRSHDVPVYVIAKAGTPPFAKGAAFGQVTLKVCKASCSSTSDARTIKIH
jgi:hypothetical protein